METPDFWHQNQADAAPNQNDCPKCMKPGVFQRVQHCGVNSHGEEVEIGIYKCESCDIEFDGA